MAHRFSILHISDFHARGSRERDTWRRRRVLGDAWLRNLDEINREGPIDLVCFTGDLADWGKTEEYEQIGEFLDELLRRLGLPRERLFPVPGNHDIDRMRGTPVEQSWAKLREGAGTLDDQELSRWLLGDVTPRGCSDAWRDETLQRQGAYRAFLRHFGRELLLPEQSPHGRLGYRATLRLPSLPFDIHIIGLDSAWLSGDEHDAGKLRLTEDQVMRLCTDAEGRPLPGYRLALMHHPLSDLADVASSRRYLAENTDLLLRGHLHEPELELWIDPSRNLRLIAAGCLYEGLRGDRWPNACEVIRISCDDGGRPQRYDLRLRGFSSRGGHWYDDGSLYKEAPHGRLAIPLFEEQSCSEPPPPKQLFVGRAHELDTLRSHLLTSDRPRKPVAVCAVQGMAGIGKTYLCEHFSALHEPYFPSGYFRLTPSPTTTAADMLDELADRLGVHGTGDRRLASLRHALRRALVHVENVDSEPLSEAVANLVDTLRGCALLVCGRHRSLGTADGWQKILVPVLDDETAHEMLVKEARRGQGPLYSGEEPALRSLAKRLGGLPLAIHLCGAALRRGHKAEGLLRRLDQELFDLKPAPDSEVRRRTDRSVLRASFTVSLELLGTALGPDAERLLLALRDFAHAPPMGVGLSLGAALAGLDEVEFERLLVEAHMASLVEPVPAETRATPGWRMHPLLAEFLRLEQRGEFVRRRLHDWFWPRVATAPMGRQEQQGIPWRQASEERAALHWWIVGLPAEEIAPLARHAFVFAFNCGPFPLWASACERGLPRAEVPAHRSGILWLLSFMAQRNGDLDRALSAAQADEQVNRTRGAEREVALARGRIADLLSNRGQIAEALKILREEVLPVYEKINDIRSYTLTKGKIADILHDRGELEEPLRIHREAIPIYEKLGDVRACTGTLGKIAGILAEQSQVGEALRILREEVLPSYDRLGDISDSATMRIRVAEILTSIGQHEEAVRLLREETLPVLDGLGDVSERVVVLVKIAEVLHAQQKYVEALQILREEALPVYERLGDIRSRAVTMAHIADIEEVQGDIDAALRILSEDVLPVCESLGDASSHAKTLGKIANILANQGQIDEALRMRRDQELPVYEKLGARRDIIMGRWNVALLYRRRAQPGDEEAAERLLSLAYQEAADASLPEAAQIRGFMRSVSPSTKIGS